MFKTSVVVLLGAFVLGLAVTVAFSPLVGAGMLLVASVFAMVLGNPIALSGLFFVWSAVLYNLLMLYPLPGMVGYLDELLSLAAVGIVLVHAVLLRADISQLKHMTKVYSWLLLFGVLSFLVNRPPALNAAHFAISYLSFYPLFCITYMNRGSVRPKHIWRIVLAFILLQLLLNFTWFAGVNPIRNFRNWVDLATGTLLSANVVAYFTIAAIVMVLDALRQKIGNAMTLIGLLVLLLLQLYFTYTNHAYILLPVAIVAYYVAQSNRMKDAFQAIVTLLVVGLLLVGTLRFFDVAYVREMRMSQTELLSYENLSRRAKMLMDEQKVDLFMRIHETASLHQYVLGFGPGNGTSSIAVHYVTPKALDLLGVYYLTFSGTQEQAGGSITQGPRSGLNTLISDLGWAGTLLFIWMHVYACIRIFVRLRHQQYTNRHQHVLASAALILAMQYTSINLLVDYYAQDFFWVPLWILVALVWEPTPEGQTQDRQ